MKYLMIVTKKCILQLPVNDKWSKLCPHQDSINKSALAFIMKVSKFLKTEIEQNIKNMSRQLSYWCQIKEFKTPVHLEVFAGLFLALWDRMISWETVPMVSENLGMHHSTAYRIYDHAKEMLANGNLDVSWCKANCGRRCKYDIPALQAQLEELLGGWESNHWHGHPRSKRCKLPPTF